MGQVCTHSSRKLRTYESLGLLGAISTREAGRIGARSLLFEQSTLDTLPQAWSQCLRSLISNIVHCR